MTMDTISYEDSREENKFAIPARHNPRFVLYRVALDSYEPVPRRVECGRLVEYDDPAFERTTGQPRYMRAHCRSAIPPGAIFIIDDGETARPYWGGSSNHGSIAPLYPEGSEPSEILCPFPVNPGHLSRPDNGLEIDFRTWALGPRKCYHLKITR